MTTEIGNYEIRVSNGGVFLWHFIEVWYMIPEGSTTFLTPKNKKEIDAAIMVAMSYI